MVKRGCGLRGLRRDCGLFRATTGYDGSRCTPVHLEKEESNDDGPSQANEDFELSRG